MKQCLRLVLAVAFVHALGFAVLSPALAERRVALVVGNSKYEFADKLPNTVSDANAIGALLTKANFDVVELRRDVGVVEFKRAIREFLTAASNADITVVYYSGHGLEIGGVNYLIPVDARLASDFDVQDETIALDRIIEATRSAHKFSLIVLDACRDNPFLRASTRAIATREIASRLIGVVATGPDTLIAYAAKAGSVSFDGSGANSPFTTALVKYIAQPGLDIRIALGKVRDDVMAETGGLQEPFVYGSLGGGVISLVPAPAAPESGDSVAADYAMAERVGSADGWRAFLVAYKSGYYASLARAQLDKLASAGRPTPEPQKPATETSRAAGEKSQDDAQQRVRNTSQRADDRQTSDRQTSDRQASLNANATVETPLSSGVRTCRTDEARLAQLRLSPDAKELASFARDLACEALRPQVKRFMESLGLDAVDHSLERTTKVMSTPALSNRPATCSHDAEELNRLRANPDREATRRFVRELQCSDLKPQAARLLESIGD